MRLWFFPALTLCALALPVGAQQTGAVTAPQDSGTPFTSNAVDPEPLPAQPEQPLHDAIRAGDVEALRLALAEGADLEARESHGRTPLYTAAREGQPELAAELLKAGARSNASNYAGLSPLHIAAARGHASTVRVLLANCADLDARDLLERTPLFLAATRGQREVVERLLREGADPSARRDSGSTPLTAAVSFRQFQVAELLRTYALAALAAQRESEESEDAEGTAEPDDQSQLEPTAEPTAVDVAAPPPVVPQRAVVPPLSGASERARFAQEKLTALGYQPGPIDGSIAERTRTSIRAFQRDIGQVVDGELSPCLLQRLATEDLLRRTPELVLPPIESALRPTPPAEPGSIPSGAP